jgi:intracellular sulfur oxidation DsrE/DsrF family protein
MKKLVSVFAVSLLALTAVACNQVKVDDPYAKNGKQLVVYHINYNDLKRQKGALRNAQNHINAVGKDKLDLRIVMHGGGFTMLKAANDDLELQNKIVSLKEQGVKFLMCANTIRGKKLDKKQLFGLKDSDIVPSGVAEIAHLEAAGYAYVKP